MISVITPTYNTNPDILSRTWASLKAQTFTDWEWVIWDDSTNSQTWSQLYGFCSDERYKISMHRSHVHSGNIGRLKRQGFMVAEGNILVELDHDDELTPDCLQEIHDAFQDESVGFVYSDWCELLPNGQSGVYPMGWAFGYGSEYWSEEYGVSVMSAPEINSTTIRHIVSAPNHVRAWRADVYRSLNGHDFNYPVADDYELIVRTFLTTKMFHIPKLLYKQHIGPSTAQRVRNEQIQIFVEQIAKHYKDAITQRCEELTTIN
jgi:glycosyltransferase involved in cell wall biosynthesis